MKKSRLSKKPIFISLICMAVLLLLNILFFYPQLQGKIIAGGDVISSTSWNHEVIEYQESTGVVSRWNPSMFSGMPWWLLGLGSNYNLSKHINKIFYFGIKYPLGLAIKCSLVCFMSLLLLRVNPVLALVGAIGFTLSVNNIILIEAGHASKIGVISNFPFLLAGLLLLRRTKYLLGASLIALSISLSVFNNHIQMVYYYFLALTALALVLIIKIARSESKNDLLRFVLMGLVAVGIGLASNFAQLISSQSYASETMRGNPILNKVESNSATPSSSEVDGLEWTYAMSWSNGVADLVSLFVPRAVGGSSKEEIDPKTEMGSLLARSGSQKKSDGNFQGPLYWGNLPFTSGPYYVGIVFCFLFVFGMLHLDRFMKAGVLLSLIVVVLLSMGSNAAWFNQLLFDYLPFFNKFRSPNSSLSILPILMIIPACLGFQKAFNGDLDRDKIRKNLWISLIGLSLFIFLMVGFLYFTSSFTGPGDQRYQETILDAFISTRKSLLNKDVLRSFTYLWIAGMLVWIYLKFNKHSFSLLCAGLAILATLDLWMINKRYLDKDNYESENKYDTRFAPRDVDKQIFSLETRGRGYYRVLDYSINTFNSALTSYHHSTIGGYHAAKLQRYQDLIDAYISKGNKTVLNMLNTKYIIDKNRKLQINAEALGNAWLVNHIIPVDSPNEEIKAINDIDPAHQAIVLTNEFNFDGVDIKAGDGIGKITLIDYKPNEWKYSFRSSVDQLAVFSETWYPEQKGLVAKIDGVSTIPLRVNYALRGLMVPAGEHEIIFQFDPQPKGAWISLISSVILIFLFIYLFYSLYKWIRTLPIESEKTANNVKLDKKKKIKPKSRENKKKRKR